MFANYPSGTGVSPCGKRPLPTPPGPYKLKLFTEAIHPLIEHLLINLSWSGNFCLERIKIEKSSWPILYFLTYQYLTEVAEFTWALVSEPGFPKLAFVWATNEELSASHQQQKSHIFLWPFDKNDYPWFPLIQYAKNHEMRSVLKKKAVVLSTLVIVEFVWIFVIHRITILKRLMLYCRTSRRLMEAKSRR